MLNYLRRVGKNEFFRNVFTLLSGNLVAQGVSFFSIPILTRLYTPEEFGAVALFISIVNVCSIAATGRYDMAIVPAKRNGHAFHLLVSSIGIAFFFSIVLFIPLLFFFPWISSQFSDLSFKKILWLVPLFVFLTSTYKSFYSWFNRRLLYRNIALNRVVQTSSQNIVKFGRSFFSSGYWGLVIGSLISEIIAWVMFVYKIVRLEGWRFKYLSWKTVVKTFRENSNFPKYLLPMGVVNAFSVNILVFTLTAITSSTIVGFYERAWRVINLPMSLMSSSFSNVFFQKMTITSKPLKFYLLSYFGNLFIATLVLLPVMLWGEVLFVKVLGKEWGVAGQIARLLAPLTIFNYATACISNVYSVYRKNQFLLIWQILYLAFVLSWIIFARSIDVFVLIQVFAFIGAGLYAILAFFGYWLILREEKKKSDNWQLLS